MLFCKTSIFLCSVLMLIGCSSATQPKCTSKASSNGYYCHKGYNFGKAKSGQYKRGVRDGCRTANGYFTKDYSSSSWSVEYASGWDADRSTCRHILPKEVELGMRTEYQQSIDQQQYYGN